MRAAVLVSILLVVASAAGAADVVARTYTVRFHPVRDAVVLVAPMLSLQGDIEMNPKRGTLTVRDTREVLARVGDALKVWDVEPLVYRVSLRLVKASSRAEPEGAGAAAIPGLPAGLPSGLFTYASYRQLGVFEALTGDGSSVEATIGEVYRIRFTLHAIDQQPDRVQLVGLQLGRFQPTISGVDPVTTLLRTTVSLRAGQTGVLAAASSERSPEALLLVLTATREPSK